MTECHAHCEFGEKCFDPVCRCQPPVGSVVLDVDGDAWQRHVDILNGDAWHVASQQAFVGTSTWDTLSSKYGPLTVIYTPEVKL